MPETGTKYTTRYLKPALPNLDPEQCERNHAKTGETARKPTEVSLLLGSGSRAARQGSRSRAAGGGQWEEGNQQEEGRGEGVPREKVP